MARSSTFNDRRSLARRLLGSIARGFDRASKHVLKKWRKSALAWHLFTTLQNMEGFFSIHATRIAMNMGRCVCCGGGMTLFGYVGNEAPYVYLACGKCSDKRKCSLHDKSKKTCIAESSCKAFQDDATIKNRVTILFNLIRMILHFFKLHGSCLVDVTRDAMDAIPILLATRDIKAARFCSYYVFYKEKLPVDENDATIMDVSDTGMAIKTMIGSDLIAAIVERIKMVNGYGT